MKKLFLGGLMAALTLGFTACDDDDENDNNYQLEVRVHMDAPGEDMEEVESIYNAYLTAMGIDLKDSTEIITIAGKDSLDCVNTILERCAKAENELSSKEWSDKNVIAVRSTEYNSVLYKQTYGTASDNGTIRSYYFDKGFCTSPSHLEGEFECATEFAVHSAIGGLFVYWEDYYGMDLNRGAGGYYIHPRLSHKDMGSLAAIKAMAQNTGNAECITDAFVLIAGSNPQDGIRFNGHDYELVKDTDGKGGKWADLNRGAGGKYLYIYVTHEHTGKIMCAQKEKLVFYDSSEWFSNLSHVNQTADEGYFHREFLPGVEWVDSKGYVKTYPDGIDLNMGAGGDWIFWMVTYFVGDKM